jgi:hypothetical protein
MKAPPNSFHASTRSEWRKGMAHTTLSGDQPPALSLASFWGVSEPHWGASRCLLAF